MAIDSRNATSFAQQRAFPHDNAAIRPRATRSWASEVAGRVRVAVTGAGPKVFRELTFEEALQRKFLPEAVKDLEVSAVGLSSDLHASAEYRANLISVLARRAVFAALNEPNHGN